MYCNCKENCFYFTSYEKEKDYICKYSINKCNRLKEDGIKKQPCDFYKKELISKIKDEHVEEIIETKEKLYKINYREQLNYYIDLCEKFGPNENYYGNIVHCIKILGYKYIPCEIFSNMKKRLKNQPDKINIKFNKSEPIINVPEELQVIRTSKKHNIRILNKSKVFEDFEIIEEEKYEDKNINDNEEEDGTFDIDDTESIEEEDDVEYEGYFSD